MAEWLQAQGCEVEEIEYPELSQVWVHSIILYYIYLLILLNIIQHSIGVKLPCLWAFAVWVWAVAPSGTGHAPRALRLLHTDHQPPAA